MPSWTTSTVFRVDPVASGKFIVRLLVASFSSYCGVAFAWWVWSSFFDSTPADPVKALLSLPLLTFFYPFSFAAAYHTVFGEPFVSHDIVPHDPVSRETLIIVFVLFASSLAARQFALGRVLAYILMAAFTVGGAVNYFSWLRQGL